VHELAVTDSILSIVLNHANRAGADRVVRIHVRISELSHLKAEWLQPYFDHLAEGSAAEGALLIIESVPPGFICGECGARFSISLTRIEHVECPHCGSRSCTLDSGDDYLVESIEVAE